ncbi:hypothetical protein ACU5EH_10840 [Aliivibrio salmonicida]|uniref:hypothetical protein n=1 Tax=Aliivibrio salmonicida TaxID=40269 RepID=UPI00406D4CCE
MNKILFSDIDFQFQNYPIGLERNIRGIWELGMMRFHYLSSDLTPSTIGVIDNINIELGITPIQINLAKLKKNYRTSVELSFALREENFAKWIWFTDVEALKDTNYAGWLRSLLTTRNTQNIRVVFIIKTKEDYFEIFQNSQDPLFKSTLELPLIK